jgi:ankyrin repeat protein
MDAVDDAALTSAIRAAKAGDAATLAAWLRAGGEPNTYDGAGWTPLLWAAVRGHEAAVDVLLGGGADPALPHRSSGGLPIHLAGHAGSVAVTERLLRARPDHVDAVWDVNGHNVLLQAAFYGHLDLARYLVGRGDCDLRITTARGLGPMDMARQFENGPMMAILEPYDVPAADKRAYYESFLARIAPDVPPTERPAQDLADRACRAIEDGIAAAASDPAAVDATLTTVRRLLDAGLDVDRLGGPLQQPPIIVAVTGNNGFPPNPDMARLRLELVRQLLDAGADPTLREKHPMAVQTVIRAAVFNHLDILKLVGERLAPDTLAANINEVPIVNGLTAMHDTVMRATMAAPERFEGYLAQAAWFVACGGRVDMEDFSGRTQRAIAAACTDPTKRSRLLATLDGQI